MLIKASKIKKNQYLNYHNLAIYFIQKIRGHDESRMILLKYYDRTLNENGSMFVDPDELFEVSNYYFEDYLNNQSIYDSKFEKHMKQPLLLCSGNEKYNIFFRESIKHLMIKFD